VSNPAENMRLLEVAASISDGTPVDWNHVQREFAESADAAIVEELHLLYGIASLHTGPTAWGSLRILEPIGQGSFATVYRAFDEDLQREVALKITTVRRSSASELQEGIREARMLARVRHRNVVTVFGAQRKDDAAALAMELIKGRTLELVVKRQGPFSAREATLIGLDLCGAVAAVHEAGLVHGDIKAHNVMREDGGRIVLMDFGTGKDLEAPVPPVSDFAGTPLYLAPEVFAGQPRTRASDIYSLGVLLYYLSTARYPVDGETRTEIDRRHLQPASRRRMRDARPDLPDAFIAVVEQAIAEDPAARYPSAGAFAAALARSLESGARRQAGPSNPFFSTSKAAAIFAVLLLSGTVVYFGLGRDRTNTAALSPVVPNGTANVPAAGTDIVYRVDAALHRMRNKQTSRLLPGDRLSPGDEIFLEVETSVPAYLYLVNEDDRQREYRLYPLTDTPAAPLPAGLRHRVPAGHNWVVDTVGGRERFVIFVSPSPVPEVERMLAALPTPEERSPAVATQSATKLRGVGGLAPAPNGRPPLRLSARYTTPLAGTPEDTRGLWVRQFAVENPGKD
jgi:eukaryotic-like serine/threonine-protein kinase